MRIAARYGARKVRVFGSVALGEAGENRDIDLLVDLEHGRSLLDQAGLMMELEELLGRKVDVGYRAGHLLAAPTTNPERGPAAMSKDPRVYLAHIMECIQKIERFTQGGKERFLQDELIHDVALRNFEVIGEAAKRLDDVYRSTHPEIPWRAIAGLRDVLIHQCEGVDLEKVWAIVEKDPPGLEQSIAGLLPPSE